jgi:hypothetical protein
MQRARRKGVQVSREAARPGNEDRPAEGERSDAAGWTAWLEMLEEKGKHRWLPVAHGQSYVQALRRAMRMGHPLDRIVVRVTGSGPTNTQLGNNGSERGRGNPLRRRKCD